jgi:hypothetical protein
MTRKALSAAALLSTALVLALGVSILAGREDPTLEVAPVPVDRVGLNPTPAATAKPSNLEVPGLDQVDGVLKRDSDDLAEFAVGAVELDFGPEAWVLTADAPEDFDGDGRTETLIAELDGLVGQPIRSAGRIDADGDEAEVYLLNDLTYRDPASDLVPWRPTPAAGDPSSRPTVIAAAVAAVGPEASVEELERERVGGVEWSASVIDTDGREHLVLLDRTGQVLLVREDR